jgi:hypothetical protein
LDTQIHSHKQIHKHTHTHALAAEACHLKLSSINLFLYNQFWKQNIDKEETSGNHRFLIYLTVQKWMVSRPALESLVNHQRILAQICSAFYF